VTSFSVLYCKLLLVIANYFRLFYCKLLLFILSYAIVDYKLLNYSKLNDLTNFGLYFRLFYLKLIYVISNYILSYSRSFYFMLL